MISLQRFSLPLAALRSSDALTSLVLSDRSWHLAVPLLSLGSLRLDWHPRGSACRHPSPAVAVRDDSMLSFAFSDL